MMKNFQKLALGLLVMVFAIGFSAFTEFKKVAEGDIYVQTGADEWTRIDPLLFNETYCLEGSSKPCYYVQVQDSNDHGETLNMEDITRIGSFQPSDKEGEYIGPTK